MSGNVRLLRASWVVKHGKAGCILAQRQDLPEEAFIGVDELKQMFGEGNRDGVLPIIAISFCWARPAHPDADCSQLRSIVKVLEQEMQTYTTAGYTFKGFNGMGIFWDVRPHLDLYQKDPVLWHPCCGGPTFVKPKARSKAEKAAAKAYEASRTAEEKEAFGKALHETMDLWYAHQGTTVYMLTQLPEGCTRKVGYDDSGWTTYERCSAEQIKKVYLPDAKWKLVLDLGAADASGQAAARRWPVGPEDFDKLIENKQFTNGADKEAVAALRRKMSTKQLGGIKELQFFAMATAPSVKDALSLGQCLNLCTSLQLLGIGEVRLSDEACAGLFSILAGGAMPKLEKLCLEGNKIGNEGTKSLSTALTSGAMVQL
eukprot:3933366-Prymnesium_polylepis.1